MPKGAAAAKRPQAPPRVRPGEVEEPAANNSLAKVRASESTKHVLQTLFQHAHEDSAVLSHLDLSSLHWQSNPGHVVEVLLNSSHYGGHGIVPPLAAHIGLACSPPLPPIRLPVAPVLPGLSAGGLFARLAG